MGNTPFMPFWGSDFVGDTLDLDATEVGAYLLLLVAQWNRDGASLPNDEARLRRIARCGRNWPKVWGTIGRFFKEDGEGVYSNKLRKVAQDVATKREVNSQNGARGGRAKALKIKDARLANASETLERNASIPKPKPDIKTEANASSKNRASRLSSDWVLPKAWGEWAVSEGWSSADVRDQAARFKDYWLGKSGKDAAKLDWEATWRNWMRNSKAPRTVPTQAKATDHSMVARMIRSGLVANVTTEMARAAVDAGAITAEECRKAGIRV